MKFLVAMIVAMFAVSANADAVSDIENAAAQVISATAKLDQVEGRRDRVAALTETIRAIETGMAALRTGQRSASIQQSTIEQGLKVEEAKISQLLGTLMHVERTSEPAFLLHPMGPLGTARSGMVAADVTPALQAKANALKQKLTNVQALRGAQTNAQKILKRALVDLQTARVQLSQAISDRTDLPKRFTADAVNTAVLVASADTLATFASGLARIAKDEVPVPLPAFSDLTKTVELPVLGNLLRKFGESDAAGIVRPGIILVTEDNALVTAPAAATVRYHGPLLDYGKVIILEPAQDTLIILAGLDRIFAKSGEVVNKDAPIGLMGERSGGGGTAQDTLYIELRHKQEAVDPIDWFIGG